MNAKLDTAAKPLSTLDLAAVTGGVTGAAGPITPGSINMGAPKYSAQWWDIVRSRGGDR